VEYDPSFFRHSPLFWPIARPAAKLESEETWPPVAALTGLFDGEAPVEFAPPAPRPRRGRLPKDLRYDARIALARVVPTREGSWHDLLNALVWAVFPRAKLALHLRQHRIIASRLGEDLRLPGSRTKEQDAIAMFDEGGVVVFDEGLPVDRLAVFGHAIYEELVSRGGPAQIRASALAVKVEAGDGDPQHKLRAADESLAAFFSREASIAREDFEVRLIDVARANG
jgi:hypothetical protein